MKGVIAAMGNGKLKVQVPLSLIALAKLLLRLFLVLVKGLIMESCPDKKLLVKYS